MAGPAPETGRTDTDVKKPGLVDRLKARAQALRDRRPIVDHLARAFEHFSAAQASMLAGAITYFGLLSFFPIVALAFAVLGFVVGNQPEAQEPVLDAMRTVLPGIFDEISTEELADAASTASIIGLAGFLYSGLGWLSSLRGALQTMFAVPKEERGNFLLGKATDLLVLGSLGIVLLVSVGSSSIVTSLTGELLGAVGLPEDDPIPTFLLRVIGIAVGVLASTLLFFVIFRLLGKPDLPSRALREGAIFAAIGFEVLKLLATFVIGSTVDNPIYGPFALVIALLVWISYFARLTMLGASWAATTPPADEVVETRIALEAERTLVELRSDLVDGPTDAGVRPDRDRAALVAGVALGAAAVGLAVSLRKVAEAAED
ncbi:MAG: YihY/virulence factor BrkB family protein [Actinomycetota bacterium]|nr:YihY/virulence factor BrkB family protein [Actinomycetota bacterium]